MVRAERFSTLISLFLGGLVLRTSVLIFSSFFGFVFHASIFLYCCSGNLEQIRHDLLWVGSCFFCHRQGGSDWIQFHNFAVFGAFLRLIAYSYASYGVLVSANISSASFSLFMCAVNISRTPSSSLSPQSAREASSTRSAWNCSSVSFFLCLRQIKLYLSNAMILCVIKMSSNSCFNSLVVVVCIFLFVVFVNLVFVLPCLDIGINSFVLSHPFRPRLLSCT